MKVAIVSFLVMVTGMFVSLYFFGACLLNGVQMIASTIQHKLPTSWFAGADLSALGWLGVAAVFGLAALWFAVQGEHARKSYHH